MIDAAVKMQMDMPTQVSSIDHVLPIATTTQYCIEDQEIKKPETMSITEVRLCFSAAPS
jgi:hypothetical protein